MEKCSKDGIKRDGESCSLNNNCIYPKCIEKTLYNLDLHESLSLPFVDVLRVPGGWIYDYWDRENDRFKNGTFVPYNNEFK